MTADPAEILKSVRRVIEAHYLSGRRRYSPALFRRLEIDPELAIAALFHLRDDGYLTERARYTCPLGDSWDDSILRGPTIVCPRCRKSYDADDVVAKLVFSVSKAWQDSLRRSPSEPSNIDPEEDPGRPSSGSAFTVSGDSRGLAVEGTAADIAAAERLRNFFEGLIALPPGAELDVAYRVPGKLTAGELLLRGGRWLGNHIFAIVLTTITAGSAVCAAVLGSLQHMFDIFGKIMELFGS